MNLYDIILLITLAYFVYRGIKSGFVAIIGGFAGIVIGAWAAGHYYDIVAQWLIEYFDAQITVAIVVSFIIIYALVNLVINVVVRLITVAFRIVPLATLTNRLIGGALGLLEGLLFVGLIIWIITLFPFDNSFVHGLKESRVANYFKYTTAIVRPLLPTDLRNINLDFLQNLDTLTQEKAEYLRQFMPKLFQAWESKQQGLQQQYDTVIQENQNTVQESP